MHRRIQGRDILGVSLPTVVASVSEGTHWWNYYTGAQLILKCTGPSPPPPGCGVGVFCLRKPSQREQWAPRICPKGARAALLLSGISAPKLWEIIKGKGALPKEHLKEQFPRSVLVPINEWVLCSTALILTITPQSKIVSHPFFSSCLCVCFLALLPFSLFIQLPPSPIIIIDTKIGGNGKKTFSFTLLRCNYHYNFRYNREDLD